MLNQMALFGKKKKTDDNNAPQNAENTQSNSVTDEMKIILEAREEEQQERQARALERQQEQEEAGKKRAELEDQVRQAARKILEGPVTPEGMTFFMLVDEIPISAVPEKEGNITIRGELRGTVKKGSDVFIYQGNGERYSVKVERIKNDSREVVDEISYERAELEITRGDIPLPTDPDEDASRPVKRFSIITDAVGVEDMTDPTCKGMAAKGNPRTIATLCEYGRFGKDPEFFSIAMDCIMTSELVTPAKIGTTMNGRSNIAFGGIQNKQDPTNVYLPVFTDTRLLNEARSKGFAKQELNQSFAMSFAQVAAISRDEHHQGFLINPGGPISFTIPTKLIDDMVKTSFFKNRFGEGAADNASLALGGTGNRKLDEFIGNGGPNIAGLQKIVIKNPTNTPEFLALEKAVKSYCCSHAAIGKLMILIMEPENDPKNKAYLIIVDCKEEAFQEECKGIANAAKPFMKSFKKIQFQLFSKMNDKETFEKRSKWLYSKLPL